MMMTSVNSKITDEYYEVLDYFVSKFGAVNPDDLGRFMVLKNLAAYHSKSSIIAAIDSFF